MRRYVAVRILSTLPVLVGISVLVFALVKAVPGDPASALLGPEATPQDVAMLRDALGLEKPLPMQYALWLKKALAADLGRSIQKRVPVTDLLFSRLRNTVMLTVTAMAFALALGLPAGVLAARRAGSALDRATMVVALFGNSMPVFWLGILLILVFSVHLGWFPTGGTASLREGPSFGNTLRHLILPSLALGLVTVGGLARLTRSAMLEIVGQDYIRTARAKGLSQYRTIWYHALKNAAVPIVTIVGAQFGFLLGGAVLTETVFGWTGIGLLIYEGIATRDLPVVLGGVLFVALAFVIVNLVTDLMYGYLDPRIRYG